MKTTTIATTRQRSFLRLIATALVAFVLTSFVAMPLLEAQRRGGSFGGSRGGSFGGSRGGGFGSSGGGFRSSPSYSPNRSGVPSSPSPSTMPRAGGSFGGSRGYSTPGGVMSGGAGIGAANSYRKSYGIPRQSTPVQVPGSSSPYMTHRYGGYGDGLMMGYMMGSAPMMWSMPFHPAFYYSRPTYVQNPNGTVEAYPPTFSFFKLFVTLAILGGIIWLVMRVIRSRRAAQTDFSQSSFS